VFDTHAHIHDERFEEDRAEVVERAKAAGITAIITVGCDLEDSARALAAAENHGLYASIGIHPHEAKDAPAAIEAALGGLLGPGRGRLVAIGETGLDYYYDNSPRETQKGVLIAHIAYAHKLGLPLIFHVRDAFDDFVEVLRRECRPPVRGVVHCFTGDAAQANVFVEEFGLKLGIGGVMTFKTAGHLRDAILAVGLDPLILETDAPYLAPVPLRGKRNEPAHVARVAEALAELLGIPLADVVRRTGATARELFALP
jgi:TatD DNase family protein